MSSVRQAVAAWLAGALVTGCAVLPGGSAARWQEVRQMEHAAGTHRALRLDYLIHVPRGTPPERGWPLLLFLHGAGERGTDAWQAARHGPPALLHRNEQLRQCIVLSPQCPDKMWWDSATLKQLLEEVIATHPVDRARLYVTGLSMGGYGAWHLLVTCPELFAAAVPICGGGDPNRYKSPGASDWIPVTFDEGRLALMRAIPLWVFHGARDRAVPLAESERLVTSLQKLGSPVRFTVYPDAGHNVWAETYADPDVWAWLFRQRRDEGVP